LIFGDLPHCARLRPEIIIQLVIPKHRVGVKKNRHMIEKNRLHRIEKRCYKIEKNRQAQVKKTGVENNKDRI